jgi:hypothetical protein
MRKQILRKHVSVFRGNRRRILSTAILLVYVWQSVLKGRSQHCRQPASERANEYVLRQLTRAHRL